MDGLFASDEIFAVLGIHPVLGRGLSKGEESVAILSHEYWMRSLGGDRDALGRMLSLDREPFTVIGVAPPGFFGPEVGNRFDVLVPLSAEGRSDSPFNQWLRVLGRLQPDQTIETATVALRAAQPVIRKLTLPDYQRAQDREAYLREPLTVVPAASGVSFLRDRYRAPIAALMSVLLLCLLIACGNVAHLLLAQVSGRRRELAIRSALGASRLRIVRSLLAESVLLSAAATAIGLVLGSWMSRFLVRQFSTELYSVFLDVSLDARVLLFTSATGLLTALFFGAAPAWRGARAAPMDWYRESGGGRRLGTSGALVVSQVAISFLILAAAGLFLRTFEAFSTLPLGFEPSRVLMVDADSRRAATEWHWRALEAVRSVPGIASAAASVAVPIGFRAMIADIDAPTLSESERIAHKNLITSDWFETFGTRLLTGRDFDSDDAAGEARVAVVNQSFARRFLYGKEPLGFIVRESSGTELRIVGVVEDAVYRSVREPAPPTIYVPLTQEVSEAPFFNLVARPEAGRPALFSRSVAEAIANVEPDLALTLRPMDQQVSATFNQERILAILAGALGAEALLLVSLGLYGVTAHAVKLRRREVGIRMALGADAHSVVRAMTGRIGILVLVGAVAGEALALWASPWVEPLLFGLGPRDPSTFAIASVVLLTVGSMAAFIPARTAARLDPASVLRDSSEAAPGT